MERRGFKRQQIHKAAISGKLDEGLRIRLDLTHRDYLSAGPCGLTNAKRCPFVAPMKDVAQLPRKSYKLCVTTTKDTDYPRPAGRLIHASRSMVDSYREGRTIAGHIAGMLKK